MTPQAQAALNLDLRHVAFVQNAAEPIRASTVSRCRHPNGSVDWDRARWRKVPVVQWLRMVRCKRTGAGGATSVAVRSWTSQGNICLHRIVKAPKNIDSKVLEKS